MSFVDREIVCLDCAQPFVFTAGEQEFYERKGFKEEPKRCKPCRELRKQRRNDAPVTPRAPRAVAANGFGFRGDDEVAPGNDAFGNRAYDAPSGFGEDGDDEDNIGNRAPGTPGGPARPRAAAPRGMNRDRGARAGGGGERRELHDATCAQCGAAARVPFKPVPGRPVYCRDCYASRAASAGGR
jgi:CxxC-x17-CxxC domain-containing protein